MTFEKPINLTKIVIVIERLAPFTLRFFCVLFLFLGFSWLGLFELLPLWLHVAVFTGFILGFLWALYPLLSVRLPASGDIISRLEAENGLKHAPLTTLLDKAAGDNEQTLSVYEIYKTRLREQLKSLKTPLPSFNLHRFDPYALRALAVLLLVAGFFLGDPRNIIGAFEFDKSQDNHWRADIWVTPPAYTGLPARLILTDQNDRNAAKITLTSLEILKGSLIRIRSEGLPRFSTGLNVTEINDDLHFSVKGIPRRGEIKFHIKAILDKEPTISFTGKPTNDDKARLVLNYKIDDDFGASEATGVLSLPQEIVSRLSRNPRPLVEMPVIPLLLPPRGTSGEATTLHNFGTHPFAGLTLNLQLTAKDDLAQTGKSDSISVTLPQRVFTKPLANALLEQRQNLSLDMNLRPKVLQALESMMIAPAVFTPETAVYLGLRTGYRRLMAARSKEKMQSVADYLYEIALFIEEGYGTEAEKQFNALKEELRKAMERNAPADEIAQLMAKLREAMAKMMAEIAKNLQNQPKKEGAQPPNGQQFNAKDMNDILKQIEDLMRSGAHEQARRLLEELQRQMAELQQAMREGRLSMQEGAQSNELSDMIRKQQELRDKTFRENREGKKGDQDLAGEQEALRRQLDEMKRNGGEQNDQTREGLEQAEREMGNAREALKKGDGRGAMEAQRKALQGLQQGAQGQAQQGQPGEGQEQGRENGQGQGNGQAQGQPRGERGNDPLGRPRNNPERPGQGNESATGENGGANSQGSTSSGERAGKILDELRRRSGESTRSLEERDYIDRLLKGLK